METITLSKSKFKYLISTQEKLKVELAYLRNIILESLNDELAPSVIKRLEKMSKTIDTGSGKRFLSQDALESYLDRL